MTAPILVTGASGNVGSAVLRRLVDAGVPVRAGSLNRVDLPGAEYARLDFTDPATWTAYDGVEVMFLLRPPHLSKPDTQMAPSLDAARAAGVRHVVFLSLQGADRNRVVPHAKLEAWLRGSGVAWTFLRPSFFMQNLTTTHRSDIRDRDEILLPAGRGATAFVDVEDIADVAAVTLLDPAAHEGRAWTPTGPEALTYGEVAARLTEVLGRPIRYRAASLPRYALHARAELGMPWAMVGVTSAIFSVARFGRAGGLTDDARTVTGRAPRGFTEFARREAHAWARPGEAAES
ncbi:MAG TPA: SDR family oxidoreductase [Dermatophilaceae bacterium]|nr:SDR family oxidoreductase [Dermatophilaceae bacterium]